MIHKSAFEENAGDLQIADDDKTGAFDASVEEAQMAEHGGVGGGSESDVLGIALVTCILFEVAVAKIFFVH